jgi:hypothetical protein
MMYNTHYESDANRSCRFPDFKILTWKSFLSLRLDERVADFGGEILEKEEQLRRPKFVIR